MRLEEGRICSVGKVFQPGLLFCAEQTAQYVRLVTRTGLAIWTDAGISPYRGMSPYNFLNTALY